MSSGAWQLASWLLNTEEILPHQIGDLATKLLQSADQTTLLKTQEDLQKVLKACSEETIIES